MGQFFGGLFDLIVNVVTYIANTVTWKSFFVFVSVCISIWVLRKLQTQKNNKFDAIDYLLDDQTEKASLSKLILLIFAIASAYIIVFNIPVNVELVLGILTIFVLKEEAKRFITKDQVVSSSTKTRTVEETTSVRPKNRIERHENREREEKEERETEDGIEIVEAPVLVVGGKQDNKTDKQKKAELVARAKARDKK